MSTAAAALNSPINRRLHHFHYRDQRRHLVCFQIRCSDSIPRGFGSKDDNVKKRSGTMKEQKASGSRQRKSVSGQSGTMPGQAPGLSSKFDGNRDSIPVDREFEERLEAVRRSAIEKKKAEKEKDFSVIDYDAPVQAKESPIGLGTKIGVGVAVVAFGLVFTFGDFVPSGSVKTTEAEKPVTSKLSEEERATLEARLKQYEATLGSSSKDLAAIEAAAVTYAELEQYDKAASLLEDLAKEKPVDPDVYRLLGEVKYELKEYEASVAAYKKSAMMLGSTNFEILRGLTNALLAAKKPEEAVQVLLQAREHLRVEQVNDVSTETKGSAEEKRPQVDPIQVDLLLGKAYSDWGHVTDAVSVYDQLISNHPNDFRGYLAKGIILKENGNVGESERMFIQARFFAPEKAKALVDRYSRG
ncbi:hypothetical protein Droror1_Dr00013344 [Drosera rotundifolia]